MILNNLNCKVYFSTEPNDVFNRLINEDIEFKNQDDKINALNKVIETTKKCLESAIQEKHLEGTVDLKLIKTFLEEYRDVLEQIDIEWG